MTHIMAAIERAKIIEREKGGADEWWDLHRRTVAEVHHGASMRMSMVSMAGRKAGGTSEAW